MKIASSQGAQGENRVKNTSIIRNPWLMAAGAVAAGLMLYWRVFGLPVYHDDVVVLSAMAGISLPDVLLTTAGHPSYYRPVGLAPLKALQVMAGGSYPAPALHAYYFVLYVLAGWLVGMLARRLYPDRHRLPWLAMAIFMAFPFNYQTVPWVSAGIHIQALAGMLAVVLFLDRWWELRHWRDLVLAWMMLPLAAFSHENGVIVGMLVAGWLLIRAYRTRFWTSWLGWRWMMLALGPIVAANIVYLIQWMSIPRLDTRGPIIHGDQVGWNLLYFGQGITYPFAQAGGLVVRLGFDEQAAAAILVTAGAVVLGVLLWRARDGCAWLGVWWYGVSILPSAVLLSNAYVVDGPRLMTLASAGAALAWGTGLDTLWERQHRHWRVMATLLAAISLIGGGWFVLSRMALHDLIAPLYQQIFAEASPQLEPVFVVNLPGWIAPETRAYALGNEGIGYLAGYYPFREMVAVNTGQRLDYFVLASPDVAPALPGIIGGMAGESDQVSLESRIQIMQTAGRVYRTKAVGNHWSLEYGGPAPAEAFDAPSVAFANGTRLIASMHVIPHRQEVVLSMSWEAPQPQSCVAFVHLLCSDDLIAQADGPPLGGLYPFEQWLPGQRWQETRLMEIPAGIPDDCLRVRLGLYYPDTGQRVPLENGAEYVVIGD